MVNRSTVVISFLLVALLVIVSILFEVFLKNKYENNPFIKVPKIKVSIRLAIIASLTVVLALPVIVPDKNMERVYDALRFKHSPWSNAEEANQNGALFIFLRQANLFVKTMDEPAGYSQAKMTEISNKYRDIAADLNQNRKNSDLKGQTVIYVLSESLMNPAHISSLETSKEVAPNFAKAVSENPSGTMVSYGVGGGTAVVEYMTLTGLPFAGYNSNVASPYKDVVPHANETPSILDYFNDKTMIHPFNLSFYNRKQAYKQIGMDQTIANDGGANENPKYMGQIPGTIYTSDAEAYKDLYAEINGKNNNQSQFIQLMTMQNHTPYWGGQYEHIRQNDEKDFIYIEKHAKQDDKNELDGYVNGVHQTDNLFPGLFKKLNSYSRPITMLFYGDHWPGIFNSIPENKNAVFKHSTEFFVWQNKAAKKANGQAKTSSEFLAPNDFSSLMLANTNTKVTPYFALQTEMMNNGIVVANYARDSHGRMQYVDNEGHQIKYSSLTKKQKRLVDDLRLVQYDISDGQNYLSRKKFWH
ncbi:LTA synthase family protein [Weissella confusa]|uniref:LTA synthase family protein n=1 Tax=Weissella confusa TaxID=1583 RepID=UPI00107FA23A|nr:LTA synthase family protein [Weissella confusa]MBJ7629463.1 LTA synthase family protein [Weissella confusa]MBJ7633747.1 LTA synthase family protein [Weissella confusa]TGE43180.1 phosphoglycerol transferase [Weissella confusa]TGE55028.1 phosphoglycerol transferase [Weissella confusa]